MTADPHDPTIDELEACFVNNTELDRIGAELNRFNPIRVMRMERMEIRHSAILAWLLDPIETHGFGDKFIKAFLGEALRGGHHAIPTALDIAQADLSDVEIYREKQNIDIFVVSPRNGWSFVIENKFYSRQSKDQLERYRKYAEYQAREMGKKLINRGIFLTLSDEKANDETYSALQYSDICNVLSTLISAFRRSMNSEVLHFLENYLEVIKEAAGMSEERIQLQILAKSLYRKHKKAIDFVIEHGTSTDFALAAENIFQGDRQYGDVERVDGIELMFSGKNDRQVSFLPIAWRDALGGESSKPLWTGCERWWAQYPLICWFQLNTSADGVGGTLFLYAEVGPLNDPDKRIRLIECIKSAKSDRVQFRNDATREQARYSKFLRDNTAKISDIGDSDAIAGAMRRLLKVFSPTFEQVGTKLSEFRSTLGAIS